MPGRLVGLGLGITKWEQGMQGKKGEEKGGQGGENPGNDFPQAITERPGDTTSPATEQLYWALTFLSTGACFGKEWVHLDSTLRLVDRHWR